MYVNAFAPPGGDGQSWATAYSSLTVGLMRAPSGAQVFVAAGNYKPAQRTVTGDPRSATFWIKNDLKVYGGFAGFEQTVGERAGLFRSTILDGDIGVPNDDSDNVDHVVKISGPASAVAGAVVLDGFTIRNGNARVSGGGIYAMPVLISPPGAIPPVFGTANFFLRNCTILQNKAAVQGGGLYTQLGRADIAWCTFAENVAESGGAIHPQAAAVHVYNSRFLANEATVRGGAVDAVSIYYSPDTGPALWFVNSVFDRNRAPTGGAAFIAGSQNTAASAAFANCTFMRNEATVAGGAIAVRPSPSPMNQPHVFVDNSILWNNAAPSMAQVGVIAPPPLLADLVVRMSIVQGGFPGENVSIDPKFADADGRLAADSPAIDSGNSALTPPDLFDLDFDGSASDVFPYDLGSLNRFRNDPSSNPALSGVDPFGYGGIVDLGAHEFQPPPALMSR